MSARRALVTGIAGQDGSYLAELLLDAGYEVFGVVRPPGTRQFPNLAHVRDRITLLEGDLADTGTLVAALSEVAPGELYHLAAPEPALEALSRVSDMILLETCLSPGVSEDAPNVAEEHTMNQAYSGVGSRPTRAWVVSRLQRFWGHGYISVTQPSHPDFPNDWSMPATRENTRAIFVGSRAPLANPLLTADIPQRHRLS